MSLSRPWFNALPLALALVCSPGVGDNEVLEAVSCDAFAVGGGTEDENATECAIWSDDRNCITNPFESCRIVDALEGSLTQNATRGIGWSEMDVNDDTVMPRLRDGSLLEDVETTTTRIRQIKQLDISFLPFAKSCYTSSSHRLQKAVPGKGTFRRTLRSFSEVEGFSVRKRDEAEVKIDTLDDVRLHFLSEHDCSVQGASDTRNIQSIVTLSGTGLHGRGGIRASGSESKAICRLDTTATCVFCW